MKSCIICIPIKGLKVSWLVKLILLKLLIEWSGACLSVFIKNLGFDDKFTGWTNECISTSSLSFLINGSTFGNFKPSRGIRQGDALSPFLFVIYIEIRSRMLARE